MAAEAVLVCLSVYLSICLYVCLSFYLFSAGLDGDALLLVFAGSLCWAAIIRLIIGYLKRYRGIEEGPIDRIVCMHIYVGRKVNR